LKTQHPCRECDQLQMRDWCADCRNYEAISIVRDLAERYAMHDSSLQQRGAPCRICLGVIGDHREDCPWIRARRLVEAEKGAAT
jgi:hypothetical protein